jgi:hypothetical protein
MVDEPRDVYVTVGGVPGGPWRVYIAIGREIAAGEPKDVRQLVERLEDAMRVCEERNAT